MDRRFVGKTGIEVSVVGLGAEHLDRQPRDVVEDVIAAALDRGITIMDMFMPGDEVRTNIGHALAGRREQMVIQGAIGSVDLREQYDISRDREVCSRYFDNMLRCLKTDYIDFGMLFFMDSDEDIDAMLANGVVELARELKQSGKIRAIGASAHNPATAWRLVEEGLVEMLMFSINPAFDLMPGTGNIVQMLGEQMEGMVSQADPARAELYRLCEARGIGITVMKSLGAGKLLSAEQSPFAQPLTPVQCIHYALTRPAVASALVGCRSREEIAAAARYAEADDAERDFSEAVRLFKNDGKSGFGGSCVYCNHCQPCPVEIDIGAVNRYLDIARLTPDAVPPSVAQHYRALKANGADCTACGQCESRCPFGVPVIANMREAARLMG